MSTELLTVAPEDTLGEVAERMLETDTRSALVTEYGRLIGILTSRDMLDALAGRVHPSEARTREWMTAEPITASASMPRDTATVLMAEHRIHHLPVVDGERPVGILGHATWSQPRRRASKGPPPSGSACDLRPTSRPGSRAARNRPTARRVVKFGTTGQADVSGQYPAE